MRNLRVGFDTDAGRVVAVDDVSFDLAPGSTLGIVGESGCGKSVTAFSLMRLLPQPSGVVLGGEVRFDGVDLLTLSEKELRHRRGHKISMIFQEPMSALNPVHRLSRQLTEVYRLHRPDMGPEARLQAAVSMLRLVGIPAAEERLHDFPHQLSGGMRQRVMIAMALALRPAVLIADEPTTALDVTIQAQILELIRQMQREMGMAVILITHDLGVIAEMADHVVVMYAGRVAERGPTSAIFARPQHLYTKCLLEAIPRLDHPRGLRLPTIPGLVPSLQDLPLGARFAPRSPSPLARAYIESAAFRSERPPLVEVEPGHWVEDHPSVRVAFPRP